MAGARARAAIACGVLAAWLQGCGQPEDEKKAEQPQDKDQPATAGTPAAPAGFTGTWKDCEGVWTYSMKTPSFDERGTLTQDNALKKLAYVVVENGEITKAALTPEGPFAKLTPEAGKDCKLKMTKSNAKGSLWQANPGSEQKGPAGPDSVVAAGNLAFNVFVMKDAIKVKAGRELSYDGTLDTAQSTATKLVWKSSVKDFPPGEAVKASDAEKAAIIAKIDAAPDCKSEPCKATEDVKCIDDAMLSGLLEIAAPAAAAQHAPSSHAAVYAKGSTTRDEPESPTKSALKPRSWAVNAGGAKLIED